ncbi:unnamed protein product [Rotaria sp. Silwood1]|nr:unnamed protein product [Rotaria sp. Silwood1]
MQGKFQMHVVPKSGHAVHEDAPEQVADCIASFLVRHKLVQANDEHFQATLPGSHLDLNTAHSPDLQATEQLENFFC